MLKNLKIFCSAWISPELRPTVLKVAVVVGLLLFLLNHSGAVIHGEILVAVGLQRLSLI